MKRVRISLVSILFCAMLGAQQDPSIINGLILQGKAAIQKGADAWDLEQMLAARAHFERLTNEGTYPWLVSYYIGFVDMKLFYHYLSQEEKDRAAQYLEEGIGHLEKAVELKDDFAEGYALLSLMLGNKIGINPMLGITLGMKSGRLMDKAFELAPENPRVSLIAGESAYYRPKAFGGGKEKALEHIQKALACFKTFQPRTAILPSWGLDEAYAYQGMILTDKEQFLEAMKSYEKAVEVNPDNLWVKNDLMPKLESRMKGDEQ